MAANGILQASKAIFYFPCDTYPLQEVVKEKTWTDNGEWNSPFTPGFETASGVVVSGVQPIPADIGFKTTHSGSYQGLTGSSGLCLAFWGTGQTISQDLELKVGFSNDLLTDIDNGIVIRQTLFGTRNLLIKASGNVSPNINITPVLFFDPLFLVADIRFSGGTTWIVRESINGSAWSNVQPITFANNFNNSTFAKLSFANFGFDGILDEVILWSDNILFTEQELSNLYELGNTFTDPMTTYDSHYVVFSASGSTDLFVQTGSAIESGTLNCFVNGVEPKPELVCPPLDPTASIQIKDSLIKVYQSRIDALINQLGKNVTLEFDPIRTPCPNCTFDRIRKRSTGIYIPGGPRPFKRGRKCPWCKGRGLLETVVTKCIQCLIKWNPEDAEKFGVSISQKKGVVRFKTFLTEADDLLRARTAVANKDIEDQMKLRVRLLQGPIPVGLRERRYCISFWELI